MRVSNKPQIQSSRNLNHWSYQAKNVKHLLQNTVGNKGCNREKQATNEAPLKDGAHLKTV